MIVRKIILALLFATQALWIPQTNANSNEYEVLKDACELSILTPTLSDRKTKKLRLANGLEVLCISDPKSSTSGVAVSVGVGSFYDPNQRPGMAHFVEHMLFLGNKKYPQEEGFSRFLDEHGGTRNAFTMSDRTVYMFSSNNDGFFEGLDRLGNFFISPLFTESGLARECKAIHQEYCKNVPIDGWRMYYVQKALSNKDHPFHRFCIGNKETLSDVKPAEIREWYNNHYSANLMKLVAYSNSSLEAMEAKIVDVFSKIPNKNFVHKKCTTPIFSKDAQKVCSFIVPHQSERASLDLTWELPATYCKDIEQHADKVIGFILGHEGENSLLSKLKKEELASALSIQTNNIGVAQSLFTLSIDLTKKGVQQYEEVIATCFGALNSLKKQKIPKYIFDEICQIESLDYSYQSRSDIFQYVCNQATAMIDEPIESYPRKSLMPTTFDQKRLHGFLQALTPDGCQFLLLADPSLTKVEAEKCEKWLGVHYGQKAISQELLSKWQVCSEKEQCTILPKPNPYLPSTLSLPVKEEKNENQLFTIDIKEESPKGKLYAASDSQFLTPQIYWTFHLKSPLVHQKDAKSAASIDLFCKAFTHEFNTTAYEAKLAKLELSLSPKEDGLMLTLTGFSPKALTLLESIAKKLSTFSLNAKQQIFYKEMVGSEYEMENASSPLSQAGEIALSLLNKDFQTIENKREALKNLSEKEINNFCQNLFTSGYLEAALYGHQSQNDAKKAFKLMTDLFKKPYEPENHSKKALARLGSIHAPIYLQENCKIPSNALLLTLDFGPFSFQKRAAQEILSKALEEPFFSELRTRQQTAYLVSNWSKEIERELYSFFAIQSSSHDPRDLLARFELFFENFVDKLESDFVSKERFEMFKSALIQKLEQPGTSFDQMGALLHTLAFDYEGDFDWLQKRIEGFKSLTYDQFQTLVRQWMNKSNPQRVAVLVKGDFSQEKCFSYELADSVELVKKRLTYQDRDNN